jgi:hypothetical protein
VNDAKQPESTPAEPKGQLKIEVPFPISHGPVLDVNLAGTNPATERATFGTVLRWPITVLLTNAEPEGVGQIQPEDRGPDGEKLPQQKGDGGIVLVNEQGSMPNQYHSRTRTDCVFQVVQRQVDTQRQASLAALQYEVSSFLIRGKAEIQARLTRLLQSSFNLGLAAPISTATGIPLVPNVTVGGKAGLSIQDSAQLSAAFVASVEADLIIYAVHVFGEIWARKVVQVDEVWQWVGKDCPELGLTGQGWHNRYTLDGPWTSIPIDWYFSIAELKAPNVPAAGNAWAQQKAKEPLHDSVRGLDDAFRNVPSPRFVPDPL